MNLFALAGIIVVVAAASCGVLWLARRNPMNERFSSQLGEHSRAFDFLGIAFAILLGFVVLQAYDSYNDAKKGAEQEAQAVLELTRTAAAFTPEEHARLERTLVCYGRAVIAQGWAAMREGEASPVVTDWGDASGRRRSTSASAPWSMRPSSASFCWNRTNASRVGACGLPRPSG